uniref:Uncharacterized protein MANES_14G094500 n=1 Tax=Rhizophora mucronata TaxID=61149 RepID=A0A2P2IMT3_RHIMU
MECTTSLPPQKQNFSVILGNRGLEVADGGTDRGLLLHLTETLLELRYTLANLFFLRMLGGTHLEIRIWQHIHHCVDGESQIPGLYSQDPSAVVLNQIYICRNSMLSCPLPLSLCLLPPYACQIAS